ncbi:TPA: hypothetical protein DEP21_03655 [Patescibacteria group bacterium]|nr:hypothetical protein [Candidatus Gracilibacteria bacterium]
MFLRQKMIGSFILDFYCSKLLLAIEIDGNSHIGKEAYDRERDERMRHQGITTVRFTNEEVINDLEKIKKEIKEIINNRKEIPSLDKGRAREGFVVRDQ